MIIKWGAKVTNMRHNGYIKIGLFACLLSAQLALGCSKDGVVVQVPRVGPPPHIVSTPVDTPVRSNTAGGSTARTYLALGDSYTIGQSVAVTDRYPVREVALLKQKGYSVDDPEIIATTGWTTGDLLNALQTSPPSRATYSQVTLLIGVNNQFQGRSLSEYQTQFTQLLQDAIHWAADTASHVIVLSIPDYGDSFYGQQTSDPAAISTAIDSFNAANLQISRQYGVQYVNITDLTRQAKGDSSLFAPDGLHYSGKEMALWVARLAPTWPY